MTPTVALCKPGACQREMRAWITTPVVSFSFGGSINSRRSKRSSAGVNSNCWGYARSLPHHPPMRPPSPATPAPVPCNTVISPPQQQISSKYPLFFTYVYCAHRHPQISDLWPDPQIHFSPTALVHTSVSCS